MNTADEVTREIDMIFAQAALPGFIQYVNKGVPLDVLTNCLPAVGPGGFDILLGMLEETGMVVLGMARGADGRDVPVRPTLLRDALEPVVLESRAIRAEPGPGEEAWVLRIASGTTRGVGLLRDGVLVDLRLLRRPSGHAAAPARARAAA